MDRQTYRQLERSIRVARRVDAQMPVLSSTWRMQGRQLTATQRALMAAPEPLRTLLQRDTHRPVSPLAGHYLAQYRARRRRDGVLAAAIAEYRRSFPITKEPTR